MSYYYSRLLRLPFAAAIERATAVLKDEGFGILTDIDVAKTLKEKLGVAFRDYRILGACNPTLAHRALELEDKVGTMLPCNVVVQRLEDGRVEVAAIDPVASMAAIDNPKLKEAAAEVRLKLRRAIDAL